MGKMSRIFNGETEVDKETNAVDVNSFESILSHQSSFDKFSLFCVQHYNAENLLFVQEVQKYKEKLKTKGNRMKTAHLEEEAETLVDRFVEDGAVYQVNLSNSIKERLYCRLYEIDEGDLCVSNTSSIKSKSRHSPSYVSFLRDGDSPEEVTPHETTLELFLVDDVCCFYCVLCFVSLSLSLSLSLSMPPLSLSLSLSLCLLPV